MGWKCAALGGGFIPNEELVRRFRKAGMHSFSIELGAPGDRLKAAEADLRTVQHWLKETQTEGADV